MPMSNPLIRSVRQGIKRAHVEMGSQQKVKRPWTWGVLTEMQEGVQARNKREGNRKKRAVESHKQWMKRNIYGSQDQMAKL